MLITRHFVDRELLPNEARHTLRYQANLRRQRRVPRPGRLGFADCSYSETRLLCALTINIGQLKDNRRWRGTPIVRQDLER